MNSVGLHTSTMSNSIYARLNNAAVDALNVGDLHKAFEILSRVFFKSIRFQHRNHNLGSTSRGESSLEFSLQDCSRSLHRILGRGTSSSSSVDSHVFLCLNFLRIDLPTEEDKLEKFNQLCSCAVSWALGYNLAIVYALTAFQRGSSPGSTALFKKSTRLLLPIQRQVMLQKSISPFWSSLKLNILNNSICILQKCGNNNVAPSFRAMEEILQKSHAQLRPADVRKFYLSMQFLNINSSSAAAA